MSLPQETAHDVLQQPHRLLIHKLRNHIREHRSYSVKALVRLADVLQAHIIQQDLLHDEDGHRLAQLGARLHDPQAQRDDLGGEQEVDDLRAVVLDQRTDDTQGGEAEVLEGSALGGGVEEGVEEEGDVCCAKTLAKPPIRECRASPLPPRNSPRVSPCDATHCNSANALHTRFDAAAVN